MPLLATRPVEGQVARMPGAAAEPASPPALDVAAAALRRGNLVSSVADVLTDGVARPSPSYVEGYDALADLKGYERFADHFIDSNSPEQTAYIKTKLDQRMRDEETLRNAGGWGLAALIGAGLTDPTLAVSMMLPATAPTRGAAVLRAVGSQLAFDTAYEAAFHAVDPTRTDTESLINVGSGAVLAGILGPLGARIPAGERETLRRAVGRELNAPIDSTAGAARVAQTTIEQETISAGGETLARTLANVSPADRLLTSPSLEARRIVQELVETTEMLNKNLEGIRTPDAIATRLKRYMGSWWQSYRERGELYGKYRQRMTEEGMQPLTRREFGQQVSAAMRRGDTSAIGEVTEAAASLRKWVFDPLRDRAKKLGLLTDDMLENIGAESYLMRQYNVALIRREMNGWIKTLEEGFARQGVDAAEARDIAHRVTRNIMGSERGTLDLNVMDGIVPKSGRLKERTLKLPDTELERWLVNDIDDLSQAYLRTMAPEVEITERFGSRDLKAATDKITEDYSVKIERATQANDAKAVKKLQDRMEADLRDVSAIRDMLYGTYGAPKDPGSFFVRAGRLARAHNYMRLLGGQVISAITDVARVMMQHGAPKMAASAFKLATNIKAMKLASYEARRMAVGLELVMNTRGIAEGALNESSSFLEQRIARRMGDVFSIATLQSPWNAVMKSWSSVMTQDDILKAAAKVSGGGALSKNKAARFAQLGLDEDMLRRIGAEAETKGSEQAGLLFAHSDEWGDQELAAIYESAVLKEADTLVQTPGVGDLPLVYSTEWGKVLLQFKSFALSSVRRMLIPAAQGLARSDVNTMQGVAMMFGAGAAVYTLKQLASGQPITDDPKKFALEVVDRSGMLTWTSDILFPAAWQMGSDDLSRWSDRQPVETLLGPTAGTIADAYTSRWPDRVLDGDLSKADVHKMRRMLPGQNLFYLRRAINDLESAVAGGE